VKHLAASEKRKKDDIKRIMFVRSWTRQQMNDKNTTMNYSLLSHPTLMNRPVDNRCTNVMFSDY